MKRTKTKLVSSIVTLLICFAMLVGSTFAWFTDSASTGVNTIQAGNLDVALEMNNGTTENPSWVNAEGKTLEFKKATGAPEGEQILWEPGCTYALPELRIVNKGNLNLKYKIEITGIQGDAKLNEVIDWAINDAAINLTEEHLPAGQTGNAFTIKGHMQETAGNEYKNLTIDGISINVYATQDKGEFDSFTDDYDAGAEYVKKTATIMSETDGKTYTLESGNTYTVGSARVEVAVNGDISYTNSGDAQTVSITTNGGKLTVNAPNDTINHYGESEYVLINAIAGNSFHEFGKVGILSVESGRVVAENGDNIDVIQVTSGDAIIAVPENKILDTKLEKEGNIYIRLNIINNVGQAVVSIATNTGIVDVSIPEELKEVLVNSGSTSKIEDAKDYVARIENEYYETLANAINDVESNETITLLKDSEIDLIKIGTKNISINLNNHTLSNAGTNGTTIKNGAVIKFFDGNINFDGDGVASGILCVETQSSLILDNVTYNAPTGAAIYPKGNAAKIEINNSKINAPTSYCVSTNAATVDNYNVIIKINNSDLSGNTPVLVNVPCALEINKSTITGAMHGVVVRGGTATIKDSQIVNCELDTSLADYFNDRIWGSGNMVNLAALTFGNKGSGSYQYPTTVTVQNSIIKSESYGQEKSYPAIYGYGNIGEGLGAILTYDEDCTIIGNVKLGNNAASINGEFGPK